MSTTPLRLSSDREHLLAAVSAADAVVPSTSTKPILTNLQLQAKPAHLEIDASDSQVGLRCLVRKVQVQSQGAVVVNSRQLAMILRESASPSVVIEEEQRGDQSVLAIHLADGDYHIPTVIGEEFPRMSHFPGDVVPFRIKGSRLESMLRKTTFAMDKERTSPTLSGLSLTIGQQRLVVAATDGKILAEATEPGDGFVLAAPDDTLPVVLPATAVSHLSRLLGTIPDQGDLEFVFHDRLLFARLPLGEGMQAEFTTRLVDGSFPAYAGALASATGTIHLTFHAVQLASAVRRVALMTTQSTKTILMQLDRDQAVFSNMNPTAGSARIPVPCQYEGGPVKYGLNSSYLADILKVYDGDHLGIEMARGLIMREPGMIYLVMPISMPG